MGERRIGRRQQEQEAKKKTARPEEPGGPSTVQRTL
jgi:hypothetical protein